MTKIEVFRQAAAQMGNATSEEMSTFIQNKFGVVIAPSYIPIFQATLRFQISTFWLGVMYLVISIPLSVVLIGLPLLGWWFIWSLVRIVKGGLLILENKPIANPRSWLFG